MAITGKQVRQLRSLAHHLDPVVIIGQNGITDAVVAQARESIEAHELIKVQVGDGSGLDVREAAHELSDRLGADLVQVIGHKFSVYRLSERKDIEHIQLVK